MKRTSIHRSAAALASVALLAGCSGQTNESPGAAGSLQGGKTDANSASVKKGGTATYSVNVDVKNWNVLTSSGDVYGYRQILNPVYPHAMISQPDFTMAPNKALLTSAELTGTSPQVVTYKIRPEAVWSDGTPISAADFEYTWKVQDPAQCAKCQASNPSGYSLIESVTGSDNGKTVAVKFKSPFSPWKLLFPYLLPAHIAKADGDMAKSFNETFASTVPTWSGGPFVIDKYVPNQSITFKPNPKWYGDKPNLDTFVVRIITDERQAVTAMANNEIQVLAPTPTLDLVTQLKNNTNLTVDTATGLLYEHVDFRTQHPSLADVNLRKAIFTAISTQAIIDKTVGQYAPGVKPLGNRNFMPGQTLDGVPAYVDTTTPLGLGTGNVEAAKKILTDAGYKLEGEKLIDPKGTAVPPLRIVYTKNNQTRKDTSVLLQNTLKPLGVQLVLTETDGLGKTITSGDFDLVIYGTNIDTIPTTTAQAVFNSKKFHTGYKDPEVDAWLSEALATSDPKKVVELITKVDQRLSEKAITLPLYQTPTIVAFRKDLANIRINPTRFGTTYNTEQWGFRA